jgi:ferredoxin
MGEQPVSSVTEDCSLGCAKSSNIPISHSKKDPLIDNSVAINSQTQATCQHITPTSVTMASHLRSRAFAKLVSNSSSLDEGVESDLSSPTVSSSFSNDLLWSSITSCYSMQVSSFESQSSQKSVNTSTGCGHPFHYMHTSIDQASLPSACAGCGVVEKKSALQTFSLMRKQRFANLKKLNAGRKHYRGQHATPRYRHVNDLRQVRLELNSLMNDLAYSNNNNGDCANKCHMKKLNTIEHTPEKEQQSESNTNLKSDERSNEQINAKAIATDSELNTTMTPLGNIESGNLLQKCKQFIFFNSSRKTKNEETKTNGKQSQAINEVAGSSKTKKVLLKQKSSSLNSLIEDHNMNSNKKCELNRPLSKTSYNDNAAETMKMLNEHNPANNNNTNNSNNASCFKKANSNSFKLKYFRKYSLNK